MPRFAHVPIDRELIVKVAFDLLETEGLTGLSMRTLAGLLGVQASALYWHVKGKDELLGLMAAHIQRHARDFDEPVADWRSWLLIFGQRLHLAYTSHRDGAWLCATAKPFVAATDAAHDAAAPLVRLGLTQDDAISMQASIISLALGWSMYEMNRPMHAFLSEMMDFNGSYERGLAAIVAGFEVR